MFNKSSKHSIHFFFMWGSKLYFGSFRGLSGIFNFGELSPVLSFPGGAMTLPLASNPPPCQTGHSHRFTRGQADVYSKSVNRLPTSGEQAAYFLFFPLFHYFVPFFLIIFSHFLLQFDLPDGQLVWDDPGHTIGLVIFQFPTLVLQSQM